MALKKARILNLFYKLFRWILGSIFVYAGTLKLLDPGIFAVLINAYGLIPEMLVMPAAVVLSALEVAAGIGLVFDLKASLTMTAGLLILFIAVLGVGLWMGLDIDCGCFGKNEPEFKAFHGLKPALFRDLLMLCAVLFLYAWRRYKAIQPVTVTAVVQNCLIKRRNKDGKL